MKTTAQRVQRVAAPPQLPISEDMAAADHVSAFELSAAGSRDTPELWSRLVFERAPALMRGLLRTGWRVVLGLRLGPRSAEHVLGWHIAERGPNHVVLEAQSRLLAAQNIVVTTGSAVTWTTLVRYDRRVARFVWALMQPGHNLVIPYLLRRAGKSEPVNR
ncbi:hypothetical protein NBRGN_037_00270 [Nocardia brasiliensis NBRC 14402]|uniref:DUF2867 domain-containing protein n=1 Tax=Nocardia brasiliensis TaxID=37326 RepID=UPI0002E17BA5|nr:DUF2867 domain-containing protein [Nocardia brasiliensis]ASF06319.1 DUF2867 domain-containing protein [Nocardia brasiliensis]GAJ81267.1 hypothetical protein NBRGN_037_00270 [Nocardia brasiliensis NBRC 14402]SUB54023.1 Protein of uncharacterised function (DUF2867) [Nocardia brasiliensis]